MNKVEYIKLHKQAFEILDRIPSYEKQRCIENMANYLAAERPVEELKAFKKAKFEAQWRVCTVRMVHQLRPFKNYNCELAVSCG